jgi:DNA-binding CsgD family transcriptional regulator
MLKITEVNCETGEVVERDETPEETAAREQAVEQEIQQTAIRQSALAKLQALGLTDAEIAAILS